VPDLFGASPIIFCTCPAFALPLKAHEAARRRTHQTWFLGVAKVGKRIKPMAGTMKAKAVFTFWMARRDALREATAQSETTPARRE